MLIDRQVIAEAGASDVPAMIGPNAVLQMAYAIERQLGAKPARIICEAAGITALPDGTSMIPESDALHLHAVLGRLAPDEARDVAIEAGAGTADYIIANRIPRPIVAALKALPASISARLVMHAIKRHAWTFIGAGTFTTRGPWWFSIDRSSAADPVSPPTTLFSWYAAVFTRLYQRLVKPDRVCRPAMIQPYGRPTREYMITRSIKP